MIARVARLYTVLVPALVFTALFDSLHDVLSETDNGWRAFLVNLLFLQNIFGSSYGSNAPLWTLSFEWWFYVLFGLLVAAAAQASRWKAAMFAGSVAVIVAVLLVECESILLVFPLWILGAVLRFIPRPPVGRTLGIFP